MTATGSSPGATLPGCAQLRVPTRIAASAAMLNTGALESPIKFTSTGTITDSYVWTGTLAPGIRSGNSCASWSTNMTNSSATVGTSTAITPKWVNNLALVPCNTTDVRLYCFER